MRKSLIPLLLAAALLLGGCDFFRSLGGRPTSADLEAKRVELARLEEQRHQARIDSMRRVEKAMADSLAALEGHLLDSLSQRRGTLLNPTRLGGLYTTRLATRYCLPDPQLCGKEAAEMRGGRLPGHDREFPQRLQFRRHLPVGHALRDAGPPEGAPRHLGLSQGCMDPCQ